MASQHVLQFSRNYSGDYSVEAKINDYLEHHPNESIHTLSFTESDGGIHSSALVVFNINTIYHND